MSTNPLSVSTLTSKFAEVLEAHVVECYKKTHARRKKQYAVYKIEVSFAAAQWIVHRRFSEFVKFNSTLNRSFPTLQFLSLPSRLHKSLDTQFLEKRRQKLNSFMIDVLDQVPLVVPILKCELVLNFLEVMKNLEKHFALDKRTKGREVFPDLYASFPFNKKIQNLTIQHGMDKGEEIPIHIAAKEGNCEGVSAQIKANPQTVSVTDFLGQTPLHVASRHGQAPVVRLLMVLGANRNNQDKRGWSPLHCACTSADLQSVLTLLEDEAVIADLQNVDGNTPLHYFVRSFSTASPEMLKDVLALFVKKGSDINAQNKSGETPLHHACWKGSYPLVVALLSNGADANLLTITEESPLQWAVREGRTNIAHFLVENGAKNDASIFDPQLSPVVVEPAQSVAEEDDDEFDDDDGSDESDDEANEKKNGKRTRNKAEGDPTSPLLTPISISPSSISPSSSVSPPNFSPANISPSNLSPSNMSPTDLSPPSPSAAASAPAKFVMGTHSRNNTPATFLPVLASPKRLLRPADQEKHKNQLHQQLLQLQPHLQSPEQQNNTSDQSTTPPPLQLSTSPPTLTTNHTPPANGVTDHTSTNSTNTTSTTSTTSTTNTMEQPNTWMAPSSALSPSIKPTNTQKKRPSSGGFPSPVTNSETVGTARPGSGGFPVLSPLLSSLIDAPAGERPLNSKLFAHQRLQRLDDSSEITKAETTENSNAEAKSDGTNVEGKNE